MNINIAYGFLDESPSLHDSSIFFCVNIISTKEKTNKQLRNIIKHTRKRIVKKKLKALTEIKFNNSDEKTREYVLKQIAKHDVIIVAVAVDKKGRKVEDTPQNYGYVVGTTVAEYLNIYPVLNLTVDKKFTSQKQEQTFIIESQKAITILAKKGTNVSINPPVDSTKESNVQLADFVAGALNFKYNQKDSHYADIIKDKIKVEKVIVWTELKSRIVNP